MKQVLLYFYGILFFIASSSLCYGQYSISGYLDTSEPNKRVYLSKLRYDEENTIYDDQIINSTVTDSLGYFSFEGQLLSEQHGLYRIHARVDETKGPNQMAHVEDLKNFHNFVFSNRDTIVFQRNNRYWFSSNTNTNLVDQQWQDFSRYAEQLHLELFSVKAVEQRNQSSSQILTELKSYAHTQKVHPLVTLVLLSGIEENILKVDYTSDENFYSQLKDSLNNYYDGTSYAEQYKELTIDLSKTETQLDLEYYKRLSYILGTLCLLLCVGIVLLLVRLKQNHHNTSSQDNVNLTNQEERVAELIIQEKSNKEIANELFISLSTVKTHIRNIYAKLEVGNRQEFVDKYKNQPRD